MATRYIQAATKQLAPAYATQINAAQSQIPAIQQLYQTLMQGLTGFQQTENQNILEGASGRGLLRSTIPVDQQTLLGQQVLGKQAEYGMQQGQQLGDIYNQIAGLNVDKAKSIAGLGLNMQQNDLQQTQFKYQKQQADRQYKLARAAAQKGY